MNKFAASVAIVTAAILNVIVVTGAGLPNSTIGGRLIDMIVPTMDFCVLASSVLLGRVLIARGFPRLGILLIGNIALFVVSRVMHIIGSPPPRWLYFIVDLYWLNLYLVTLSIHWRMLLGQPSAPPKERHVWDDVPNRAA